MASSWRAQPDGSEKAGATSSEKDGAAQGPASCPFCGAGNSKRSLVCWSCGKVLTKSAIDKNERQKAQKKEEIYRRDYEAVRQRRRGKIAKVWTPIRNLNLGTARNALIISGSIIVAALLITSFLPRYQYAESVITKSDDNRGDHIVVRQTIFDMVTGKRYQRELQLEGSRFYRVTNISVHDDPKRPLLNIWEKQGKAMRELQTSPEIWYGWESEDEWDDRSSGGGHTLRQYQYE